MTRIKQLEQRENKFPQIYCRILIISYVLTALPPAEATSQIQNQLPNLGQSIASRINESTNHNDQDEWLASTLQPPSSQQEEAWPSYSKAYKHLHYFWNYLNENPFSKRQQNILIRDKFTETRLSNQAFGNRIFRAFDIDAHRFNTGDLELDKELEQLTAGTEVNDELCGRHLAETLNQIDEYNKVLDEKRGSANDATPLEERHIKLSLVLDAFGRYESGQLRGKSHLVGSYNQCLRGSLDLNGTGRPTPTRYCWARMKLDKHLDPRYLAVDVPIDKVILVGACLPETCHTRNLRNHKHMVQRILDTQFKLPTSIYANENLELDSVFCLPDSSGALAIPLAGKILIGVIVFWLCLLVTVTIRNRKKESAKGVSKINAALDIYESWNDFVEVRIQPEDSRVDLSSLSFVKALSSLIIVLGHSYIFASQSASVQEQLEFCINSELDPLDNTLMGATVYVETFFAMSGILTTYIILKKLPGKFNFIQGWFASVLARYTRLIPIFYLVFLFKKAIFLNMGTGPFWDYGFNQETLSGGCRKESWFGPLILQSAFLPLNKQCLQSSWSVSTDTIMSVAVAPVILLLTKRPKVSVTMSVILTIVSVSLLYSVTKSISDPLGADMANARPFALVHLYKSFSHMYTGPQYHLFSVFVGLIAGYALFRFDVGGKNFDWPYWFRGPATWLSFLSCALIYVAPGMIAYSKQAGLIATRSIDSDIALHYYVNCRLLWVIANSIIILRLVTDWKRSKWASFYSNRIFQLWSKLNLCFLLIQMDIMAYFMDSRMEMEQYTKYQMVALFSTTMLVGFLIAIPMYVLIENPINRLMKVILTPERASKQVTGKKDE